MSTENEKTRVSLHIDPDLLKLCDENLETANARSRNEFFIDALHFYLGYLRASKGEDYLLKSLSSVINDSIEDTENRIARIIFKLAVEQSMTMHVIASLAEVDSSTLDKLRVKCMDEVKRTGGTIKFDEIYRYQKRL
jgi:metal-responsive CopG/Arc/MetJ family transcriptional regulator